MDNNTPIYQYANPMGTHLRPPEHSEPITTSGFEISLDFIEFVQKNPSWEKLRKTHIHTYESLSGSVTSFA
jgi:hypothetical protein